MIRTMVIIGLLYAFSGLLTIFPVFADAELPQPTLMISVKTDQGYYASGDLIRIRGTVTNQEYELINSSVSFRFQNMKKTIYSGTNGPFLTMVPSSPIMPENLYKMEITAKCPGYEDKTLTIPVIIMSEPSSIAPARTIPDEFI